MKKTNQLLYLDRNKPMKTPSLWFMFILIAYGAHAQDTSRKYEPYLVESAFFEKGVNDELPMRALTHTGDTVDLNRYINTRYQYPTWMREAGIDGRMYYEVRLDSANHVDSLILLRALYQNMDHQPLANLLTSLRSLLVPPGVRVLDLRISIALGGFWPQPEIIKPLTTRKRRKR